MLHVMGAMDLPPSVSNVQPTMSQHPQTLALPVHTETTLLRETTLVLLVMLLAMAALELQLTVSCVPSITNLLEVDRHVLLVLLAFSLLKTTPPVLPAMSLVSDAQELQLLVNYVPLTTNLVQDQLAQFAL